MSEDKKITSVAHLIKSTSVTVNFNGETHTVYAGESKEAYDKIVLALAEKRYDDLPKLVSKAAAINSYGGGRIVAKDGQIFVDDEPVPGRLGRKIFEFLEQNLPNEPLIAFWKNVKNNPSFRAVNQLFDFLEANDHPITEDGCFIAYKKVRWDGEGDNRKLVDIHSGKFDNSVGRVVEVARNQVDEDPEQTCSFGLHVAAWQYASQFYGGGSDPMLEVKVNPADVVAVPKDYNQQKMRVCRYETLSIVTNPNDNKTLVKNPGCEYQESEFSSEEEESTEEGCTECDGFGNLSCETCDGSGMVTCEQNCEHDCEDCEGSGEVECSSCIQ